MTQALIDFYRKLDRLQQAMWFRIAASVLVLALCGGFFGVLLGKSYSLDSQRRSLNAVLSSQNLARGDEHALSLKSTGEVLLNNRRYGGPQFINPRFPIFDTNGNITSVPLLVEELLVDQRPHWAPGWLLEQPGTTWLLAIVATAWLLLIVWLEISIPFVLTMVGTAVPVWLCWTMDKPQAMLAFAGIGTLTFTFVLLTRGTLLALARPNQILSVAHTMVKEASRTRIALVFIVLLLLVLPILPMWLDPQAPLRFRIQTYISLSMRFTFALAACMTLFLACASVAFEIRDRQIWQLMTKPMGRLNYLLGKWVGIMAINVIILLIAGVSTFGFVQYLRTLPVAQGEVGRQDVQAIYNEVLTARIGGLPDYDPISPEDLRLTVDKVINADPELAAMDRVPLAKRMEIQRQLLQTYSVGLRTVSPNTGHNYVFSGLNHARTLNAPLTLRYRFHILADDEHKTFPALFTFTDLEGRPIHQYQSTYVPTMSHSITLVPELIQSDGTLHVNLTNNYEPTPDQRDLGWINFEEKDFELLYKVSSFEANFFRAMLITWVKLAFLAALGISCATFLSFPVACLLAFTVFISGVLGPYLAEAMEWYYPDDLTKIDWSNAGAVITMIFETFTRWIAIVLVFLLSSFGEIRPTQALVEGRLISWPSVIAGIVRLGVLWSGISLIIGYLVMRSRQLAIYSGHG